MKKIIFISYFIILVSLPFLVSAAGLLPCTGLSCNYCSLFQLIKNVLDFAMTYILFPVATVMVIYGGFTILVARDNAGLVKKGRDIIAAAVIGIVIALISWTIINTIFNVIVNGNSWTAAGLAPWNTLDCTKAYKP